MDLAVRSVRPFVCSVSVGPNAYISLILYRISKPNAFLESSLPCAAEKIVESTESCQKKVRPLVGVDLAVCLTVLMSVFVFKLFLAFFTSTLPQSYLNLACTLPQAYIILTLTSPQHYLTLTSTLTYLNFAQPYLSLTSTLPQACLNITSILPEPYFSLTLSLPCISP